MSKYDKNSKKCNILKANFLTFVKKVLQKRVSKGPIIKYILFVKIKNVLDEN